MDSDLAFAAANALRNEIAALDVGGVIVWVNDAWARAARQGTGELLAGAVVGSDLLALLRSAAPPAAAAVARGIALVLRGAAPMFQQELFSTAGGGHWLFFVAPLPDPRGGAVVARSDISMQIHGLFAAPPDPDDLPARVEQLSPRERDVLQLMVRGLDNRQIAAELGIGYTTVRSHTQSIIEKFGARSRLQAVARAYRGGVRAKT
jgi:DNA-binding CsgD family transcriptional regulator